MYGRPEDLFRESAQRECSRVAGLIVEQIRESPLTPVRTGRMRHGYEVLDDIEGATIVNPAAPYWIDVELGHDVVDEHGKVVGHAAPQPHVRPSIDQVEAKLR